MTGCYARLAATYEQFTRQPPARGASVPGRPYVSPEELRTELVDIAHSLAQNGAGLLATGGALGRLIRAVDSCGFHLATLDLRQNSDVHARVIADLLEVAGVEPAYLDLDEDTRVGSSASRAGKRAAAREPVRRVRGGDTVRARHRARGGPAP